MAFLQRWVPVATALAGLLIVLNEAVVHRGHSDGNLIGTGIAVMAGSGIFAKTNGKH